MTYFYDKNVEYYGKGNDSRCLRGTYITPNGEIFDVDGYSIIAHAGGFVIPFFRKFMHPDIDRIACYDKEELLSNLKLLLTKEFYDELPQEHQMRLYLLHYLINVFSSDKLIWNCKEKYVDFSKVTGFPNIEENWRGGDETLKSVLVQACDYDSIESQLYRTITTSKFNIYETFYDYILHDYRIFQIPKKIYDENSQQYIDYKQSEWLISDRELRLKLELESICKGIPLEERDQYCRVKKKEFK